MLYAIFSSCQKYSPFVVVVAMISVMPQGLAAVAQAPPGSPRQTNAAPESGSDKTVVAYVNGEPITRQELAEELLIRKGKDQLELLINRRIIEHACREAGIQISDAEIDEELKDMIRSLPVADAAEFEEKVLKERNSTLYEYKTDVLKPTIAMRKLAGSRIKVTEEDIRQAYEASYGEKVRCRVIVAHDRSEAFRIHGEVRNSPEAFLQHARNQKEPGLAAVAGQMRINRYSELDEVEKEAFRLKDGEVSQILEISPQRYVIMMREALEPANKSRRIQDVSEVLGKEVLEKKVRVELPKVFAEIRKKSVVRDYLNNKFDLNEPVVESSPRSQASRKSLPSVQGEQ